MNTVCEKDLCTGCMACVDSCSKNAISISDNLMNLNAIIDSALCVNCGRCYSVCQNNNSLQFSNPISWKQGWILDENARKNSSSGGAAFAITKAFIENGGIVCSCLFRDGSFIFDIIDSIKSINQFVGSKYVKSNPQGIYKKLIGCLRAGRKVLFIGLPCQVAAAKLYVGKSFEENFYTIDLICHGSPSVKLLERYLNEHDYNLKELSNINFRSKEGYRLSGENIRLTSKGIKDKYTISFISGLIYTENCYSCQFARTERISDITLGDAWGSELSQNEQAKGISLLICQNIKGEELLNSTEMHLETIDSAIAIKNNHQLSHPSVSPGFRCEFFEKLSQGLKYDSLIKKYYLKECLKQEVKVIVFKFKGK